MTTQRNQPIGEQRIFRHALQLDAQVSSIYVIQHVASRPNAESYMYSNHIYPNFICLDQDSPSSENSYTVEPVYNDIGLGHTPSIPSDILWYQLIPHC